MLPIISKKKGFTLIELLVVIAILSVLLVIVLVAINPAQQTRAARDTQRRADVLTVLNSVNQFFVANGSFPTNTPASGSAALAISSAGTGANFCTDLTPTYVAAFPFDPTRNGGYHWTSCSDYDTGYEIQQTAGDRITISAPKAEGGVTIQATR
jgi:prepilin-type N-terminal cleavage/methylation domain-containing protein